MLNAQSQAILLDILRRESRSLLVYIGEAFPWTTQEGGPTLEAMQQAIHNENEAINAIGKFLFRHHVAVGPFQPYPMSFTSWNFIDVKYLLPRLVEVEKQSLQRLDADIPGLDDKCRPVAVNLQGVKRMNLAQLEGLAAAKSEPATV